MTIRPLILCSLLFPLCVYAQVPRLWGMATGGGATDQGTIFHVDADGTDFNYPRRVSRSGPCGQA